MVYDRKKDEKHDVFLSDDSDWFIVINDFTENIYQIWCKQNMHVNDLELLFYLFIWILSNGPINIKTIRRIFWQMFDVSGFTA